MFNLIPSWFLRKCFIIIGLITFICLCLLPVNMIFKSLFSLILGAGSYYVYQKKLIHLKYCQLKQLDNEVWLLSTKDDDIFEGSLLGDSVINSLFSIVILRAKTTRQTEKLLICKDMLPAKQYHRLLLQLKGLIV